MRSHPFVKLLVGALIVVGAGTAVVAPAGALDKPTIPQTVIPVTPDQTEIHSPVSWSGATPNQVIYLDICKKSIADPSFSASRDCAPVGSVTTNGTPSGSGTFEEFYLFRGQDIAESGWGCFTEGDVAPAGVTKFTTCYVRVTENNLFNNDADQETAFTLVPSGGDVPEAPVAVLLPVLGTLAALGGFVLIRRRQGVTV